MLVTIPSILVFTHALVSHAWAWVAHGRRLRRALIRQWSGSLELSDTTLTWPTALTLQRIQLRSRLVILELQVLDSRILLPEGAC